MQTTRYIREGVCGFLLRGGPCRSTYRISDHLNEEAEEEEEGVEMGPGAKELTKKRKYVLKNQVP